MADKIHINALSIAVTIIQLYVLVGQSKSLISKSKLWYACGFKGNQGISKGLQSIGWDLITY